MKRHSVIIVGAGLSGLTAACRMIENGQKDIALVRAGSGGTPYIAACNVVLPDSPDHDSLEQYCSDMRAAGYEINDPAIVEAIGRGSSEALALLERWGVQFSAGDGYRYRLRRLSGSACPRSLCRTDMLLGAHMENTLAARLAQAGVCFYDNTTCLRLLKDSAGIAGVAVMQNGKAFALYSRCVLAAWGGVGNLFSETTYPADIDGRTLAMGFEAGARLIDLEFLEFEPMVCQIPGARGEPCPTAMLGEGGYLRNAQGERFLLQYRPQGEAGAPKTLINNAIARECREGRANRDGSVYVDLRHISPERLKLYPWFYERLLAAGLDPHRELIPVGPMAHSHSGGLETDAAGRTNIPGLYAAGEAAGGAHGACRMAGNACTQAAVSGLLAADAIAAEAPPAYEGAELPFAWRRDDAVFNVWGERVREIVWTYINRERTEYGLQTAIDALRGCIQSAAGDDRTVQLALSALLMAAAAKERCESRGTHYRADFPQKEASYQCGIRLSAEGEQICIERISRRG